ncbi:MAG TPA: kelch repeat-containing protein [Candidatus Eisenbacteria bacterium]|nr:kelch repeat-containing protein [Candidatus Eisenbacteria bacterium]
MSRLPSVSSPALSVQFQIVAFLLLCASLCTYAPASASPATADGHWTSLPFPPPSARVQHSAIYDPVRNRMVVFGGLIGATNANDVWELTLGPTREWKRLKPTGTAPAARRGHVAIYDPVGDRMIVQGGTAASSLSDTWALSLSGATPVWTQLMPSGTPPSARFGHTGIHDSARNRLVIHGGQSGIVFRNDVWALTLSGSPAWTQITPTGGPPATRSRHTAVYDTVRDRMVVFGGTNGIDSWNDTWALPFAGTPAWSELLPSGTPPTPRFGHEAIYDAPRDRMVVHGGEEGGEQPSGAVFTLGFASPQWSAGAPSGTAPLLYDHSAIFDTAGDRMVFFAGSEELPTKTLACLSLAGGMSWVDLAPIGVPPFGRSDHAAAYDTPRDRMIVFGGSAGGVLQDVWSLQMVGLVWTKLNPSGQAPSARTGHLMIHDPPRDRMLVFGGADADGDLFDDVWALNLAGPSWTQINPAGGTDPPPRSWTAGVYDPTGDRLVLFGGYAGNALGDVWQLTLSGTPAWSLITPTGGPPASRWLHCAARIPGTNEMLVIAGTDSTLYDDVWKLNLNGSPAWTQLSPGGLTPPARFHAAAIYDPVRSRVVMYGGSDLTTPKTDTWALSVSGSPTWSQLAPTGFLPVGRFGHSAIYDPVRDRVIVYGGVTSTPTDETLELAFGTPTGVEASETARAGIRLRAAYPNPFHAEAVIAFDLARAAVGVVSVYDVHGRRIRELQQGLLPAGAHRVRWEGKNDAGSPVASGSYFYRLEAEGIRLTRKLILSR